MQRFITMFTKACHLYLCWAERIQCKPSHPNSGTWTGISYHLQYDLPSSFFQIFWPKPWTVSLLNAWHMPCPSRSSWFDHPNYISYREKIKWYIWHNTVAHS
jgi:hypothetical protein